MADIAIIGAGLAGLTAARRLVQTGRTVCVFDKSRGLGGRLGTRRTDLSNFDHGAPIAQGDPSFDAAMEALGGERYRDGWRGEPGMSSLVGPLADGLDIVRSTRIVDLERGSDWTLRDAHGDRFGPFERVLIAIPAPQTADLVPHLDLSGVRMSARWTLMAVWPGLSVPHADGPFEEVCDQSDRPNAVPGTVVAHASADWSASNLEYDAADVAIRLGAALGRLAGTTTGPDHARAHRWRYARTAVPLGVPFVEAGPGALAGGDWALGDRAGDAWTSGMAMAHAVLAR